jgi:glucose-1-phosphatase
MPDKQIKNLIFDLGGVILDLSVDHTLQAFSDLSGLEKDKVQKTFHSEKGFELYEKGLMDDRTFRDFVRMVYNIQHSDEALDKSWNAMLRGIPVKKLDLLLKLQKSYRVFLLSNTNNIHINYIHGEMLPSIVGGDRLLDDYFHKAYYSHVMKKRKPDAEIFEQVLDENNLVPEQTLFLDDNFQNIEGANALGIKTFHVTSPDLIFDYFHE